MNIKHSIIVLVLVASQANAASPQKGTEILWDKFGVAHVFAKNTQDLFYGYGWATAQSHGNLLMKLYGESRGRAAEYFGQSGLAIDRWVWTNSVPQRSAKWLAEQTPEFRSYMEAFAKGINDYAAKNPNALSDHRQAGSSRHGRGPHRTLPSHPAIHIHCPIQIGRAFEPTHEQP